MNVTEINGTIIVISKKVLARDITEAMFPYFYLVEITMLFMVLLQFYILHRISNLEKEEENGE